MDSGVAREIYGVYPGDNDVRRYRGRRGEQDLTGPEVDMGRRVRWEMVGCTEEREGEN